MLPVGRAEQGREKGEGGLIKEKRTVFSSSSPPIIPSFLSSFPPPLTAAPASDGRVPDFTRGYKRTFSLGAQASVKMVMRGVARLKKRKKKGGG